MKKLNWCKTDDENYRNDRHFLWFFNRTFQKDGLLFGLGLQYYIMNESAMGRLSTGGIIDYGKKCHVLRDGEWEPVSQELAQEIVSKIGDKFKLPKYNRDRYQKRMDYYESNFNVE